MSAILASTLVVGAPPKGPPPPPPGGYWTISDMEDPPPRTGRAALITGAILAPLGVIRTGTGVLTVVTASGPDCPADPDQCESLRAWGWAGVGVGGLMLTTGVVFLAIGGTRRARYLQWKADRNLALLPRADRRGAGLSLSWRF